MEKTVKNIENVVISVQKLTQIHSTKVENTRQINLFMQNKPNFPHFSPKNEDYAKKQTQFKPNSNPITSMAKNECFCADKNPNDNILLFSRENLPPYKGAKNQGWQSQTNPIQTQFYTPLHRLHRNLRGDKPKALLHKKCDLLHSKGYCVIGRPNRCRQTKWNISERVPNKINRSTENERLHFWQGRRSRQCTLLSMEPDAVQKCNKPFECRVILLGAPGKVLKKC
jgi:hypothetical protein